MEQAFPWVQVHTWTGLVASYRSLSCNNSTVFTFSLGITYFKHFSRIVTERVPVTQLWLATRSLAVLHPAILAIRDWRLKTFLKTLHNFYSFQVGADIHTRKKFSFSSERLSETVSLRLVSLKLYQYGSLLFIFSVKNQQQCHWRKMEQAQGRWQAVS